MKLFNITIIAGAACICGVFSLPADTQPGPSWSQIGVNSLGPVYSSVAPQKRDVFPWFEIGKSEQNEPVFSNVQSNVKAREVVTTSVAIAEEFENWLKDVPTVELDTSEDPTIKKRQSLAGLTACIISCGEALGPANGRVDDKVNRIRFCLARCLTSVGFTNALRDAYLRRYGDAEWPTW